MTDYLACEELECQHLKDSDLTYCQEAKQCPFAYQRHREEIRQEQQRRDAEAKG